MKTYKASVTDKSGRKTVITGECGSLREFKESLHGNGYRISRGLCFEASKFDWLMKHTNLEDWEIHPNRKCYDFLKCDDSSGHSAQKLQRRVTAEKSAGNADRQTVTIPIAKTQERRKIQNEKFIVATRPQEIHPSGGEKGMSDTMKAVIFIAIVVFVVYKLWHSKSRSLSVTESEEEPVETTTSTSRAIPEEAEVVLSELLQLRSEQAETLAQLQEIQEGGEVTASVHRQYGNSTNLSQDVLRQALILQDRELSYQIQEKSKEFSRLVK